MKELIITKEDKNDCYSTSIKFQSKESDRLFISIYQGDIAQHININYKQILELTRYLLPLTNNRELI